MVHKATLLLLLTLLFAVQLVPGSRVCEFNECIDEEDANEAYGYLLATNYEPDAMLVKTIMRQLHRQQHPPKETCKHRRILVTQFANSFEGMGSILKLVLLGLAEAAHENRTLVWGLDLPFMFENSREEWFDNRTTTGQRVVDIKGIHEFDCGDYDYYDGSGPYSCFFQALSTCTIDDVSFTELSQMGPVGFDDSRRVRIQEERRAPAAAYHFPLYNPAFSQLFVDFPYPVRNLRHKWAAALGAYVFRPKPDVLALLESRRKAVWPMHLGGDSREPHCNEYCPATNHHQDRDNATRHHNSSQPEIVWGVHVRHGDLKALKDVYGNRQVYEFHEYLQAVGQRATDLATTTDDDDDDWIDCALEASSSVCDGKSRGISSDRLLPAALYVATDSLETKEFIADACRSDSEFITTWPEASKAAYGGGHATPPCVFTVNPDDRFRTEHGSHTVAAGGGCHGNVCAMHWYDILKYQNDDTYTVMSKAKRMMITLYEAMEDLYLLSLLDFLVGTMSSHFTTQAALLIWARTGARDISNVLFLDHDLIEHGTIECTFLLRPLNRTNAIDPSRAHERWIHQTRLLLEGLSVHNTTGVEEGQLPVEMLVAENPMWRVYLEDSIPTLPQEVLVRETARWMGTFIPHRVWPGECESIPAAERARYIETISRSLHRVEDVSAYLLEVGNLINWGAEQSNFHPQQAMRCWHTAQDILQGLKAVLLPKDKNNKKKTALALTLSGPGHKLASDLGEYEEILEDNQRALQGREMYPYSLGKAKLKALLQRNFGRINK